MLKVKRIMCLLSFLLPLNTYDINTITPFHSLATKVVEDNGIKMVNNHRLELFNNLTKMHNEKIEQSKLEEKLQNYSEKSEEPQWREFILTFYTSLEFENSSAGPVTCQNKPLRPGGVANNIIPLNTKIYLDGYGQVVVNDRGSDKYFAVDNRLDVFIPRNPGEGDRHYSKRVNDYGVQKVSGYIIE